MASSSAVTGAMLGLALLLGTSPLPAQETPDSRAFKQAVQAYQIGVYDRAEREFAQFVMRFPDSPMLPEAILLQARAAIEQTNLTVAVALLNSSLSKAGPLTDQYRYWMAKAHFLNRGYAAASESFASLTKEFTNSALLLEASHGEALARFRLRDFPKVVALLQQTNGAFQTAARTRPTDVLTAGGYLLLGEALFAQQKYAEAEEVVRQLPEKDLTPEFKWDRQHLHCRILTVEQRLSAALDATTNLVTFAMATTRPNLVAASVELQGELLEHLNRLEEAIAVYTNNLTESVPIERRRLALLHIIEIKLSQEKIGEAAQMLESFLPRHPEDAASDVVLLTIGELQLKMHRAAVETNEVAGTAPPRTNHLQQALVQFERFLVTQTNSPLRGKAFLDKGWCLWLDGLFDESAAAFKAAAALLPWSEDLAQARFKLGDAQFSQNDFTNAIASYRAITNDFAAMPRVRAAYFDHALYQMLRANLGMRDLKAASETKETLLAWFPRSSFGDRSLLLVGQGWLDAGVSGKARENFAELVRRSPESPLRAETELAIARSYAQERDWDTAIANYQEWIARFATNSLRPQAEFDLARSHWQAGRETDAFRLFTNFFTAFPTNAKLAPLAQYWVGDYYMRQGNYTNAQSSFQRIVENTNWPATRLTYQARFAAGRAAYARQDWSGAAGDHGHFTLLVNDVQNCPPDIAAEALFAYGDTLREWNAVPSRPLERFSDARTVFQKILPFATNQFARRLIPLAWGGIGDCSLQLAGQDAKQYELATNAYLNAMTNMLADVSTRSRAEYGLARALEAQASGGAGLDSAGLRNAAFEHYYNIALGTNLGDGEAPDPFWLKEAGFAAARIKEEQRQWTVALNIYKRLQDVLGLVPPRLQEKIDKVRDQLDHEKN